MCTDVKMCVNSEMFDRALLPCRPELRFTWHNISRLHNIWNIRKACKDGELHISKDDFIQDCLDIDLCSKSMSSAVYVLCSHFSPESSGQPDLLILVLYIQLVHDYKIRLIRSSSLDRLSREIWPIRNDKLLIADKSHTPKTHEEEVQVRFLIDTFSKIWNLLENGSKPPSLIWNHLLRPIIMSGKNVSKVSFSEVVSEKYTRDIPDFVISRLAICNNGVLNCIKSGRWISWPLGHNMPQSKRNKPKMATDSHMKNDRKIVVINQLSHKTLGRMSSTLEGASVKIHRCNNSYIYLLSSMESLTITKCQRTRIVCGLVYNVIRIRDCSHIEIVALGSVVLVGGTCESSLHVNTNSEVIVDGETCRKISFHPYCANFTGLDESLKKCDNSLSYHQDCLLVNAPGQTDRDEIVKFDPRSRQTGIPFQINMEIEDNVCSQQREVLDSWKKYLKSQELNEEEEKAVEIEVNKLFQDWCTTNRKTRELTGLRSLAQNS